MVAALRGLHFAHGPGRRGFRDAGKQGFPAPRPGVRAKTQQRAVVVEHFLEVGNFPALIDAVAAEAAPDLVEDAAFAHPAQRGQRHVAGGLAFPRQQEAEVGRMRELRRAAEAAMHGIEGARQHGLGRRQRRGIESACRRRRGGHGIHHCLA